MKANVFFGGQYRFCTLQRFAYAHHSCKESLRNFNAGTRNTAQLDDIQSTVLHAVGENQLEIIVILDLHIAVLTVDADEFRNLHRFEAVSLVIQRSIECGFLPNQRHLQSKKQSAEDL